VEAPAAQRPVGFDPERYLREQADAIRERARRFENKLYLEFGGKLVSDQHAARTLPGYDPNAKVRLLQELRDQAEIVLCIHAGDIERKKLRADFGITYDADTLRMMDDLRDRGLEVTAVVITRFRGQPAAVQFKNRLERRGLRAYTHEPTPGYPSDVDTIVSERGYGANPHIETRRPIVVVTGPGPGSGKMATCLSQLYHDHRRGVHSGYAKFETFPIWNLPLSHPVNIAYEAATADLADVNVIDPFHLEATGEAAVNYNRDVEIFPVLRSILERITGRAAIYRSPTEMGVNRAGFAITDDACVCAAAVQEVIRRSFRYRCEYALGSVESATVARADALLQALGARPEDRGVVAPARAAAARARAAGQGNEGVCCGAALELPDGRIVTGRNSPLQHAASSLVLNATKILAGLPDPLHLLSPGVIESIGAMKRGIAHRPSVSLNVEETLIALAVSATGNPAAQLAMDRLGELRGCEAHLTHMPTPGDEAGLRRLGVNLTSDPAFPSRELFPV
jgi:uncharacterized protein (UPF0371 family)